MAHRCWFSVCGLAMVLILLLAHGAGCATTRTAPDAEARRLAAEGAARVPDAAWPDRWTEGLHPFVHVETRQAEVVITGVEGGRLNVGIPVVRRAIPVGNGLVTFVIKPGADGKDQAHSKDLRWEQWESEDAIRGVRQFNFYAWDQAERPVWDLPRGRTESPDDLVSLQRAANRASITARFRLIMPEDREPRGLILFVPPISAASLSLPVPRELIERGWAVLSVDRLEVLQVTRTVMVIDVPWVKPPRSRGPKLKPPDPPAGAAGRWMGEWIRGDMADMAYAFEAGLDFAQRSEPVLKDRPVVVLGTSLGAIFSPPLIERLGERVRGAVLIGGGANMLRIMAETDPDVFNIGLLYGEGDVRLTPERGRKWAPSYLENNPLDPVHTAPVLARIPTLMIHAKRDGLVPHQYGDLLWERAGKPERWTVDAGHIWLFLTLKDQSRQIAEWIDRNVPGAKDQ